MKGSEMSVEERKKYQQEMKERFQPHARAVPATIQGLASLANERIEDAIARGQFKNLPRGKKLEADANASSPFIDTTEYLLNKIIMNQDVVPPWIEKQQELAVAVNRFRGRLRNDWKRHASRVISSSGGSLRDQVQRAEAYAAAELAINPPRKKEEPKSGMDVDQISQINLAGELHTDLSARDTTIVQRLTAEDALQTSAAGDDSTAGAGALKSPSDGEDLGSSQPTVGAVFRDPTWEAHEATYHNLSIQNLNSLTRSYNLQAPELAKKPYFNLARELRSCYADVAPQIPQEIVERARAPKSKHAVGMVSSGGGVLKRLGAGAPVRVRDERKDKQYGFKQFWRDIISSGGTSSSS
jgi:hypothetical protein